MVQDYMMRASVRLADLVFPMHPRVDDQLRPCKSHNRPRDHLPYPVVADDNHTLVNQRAADVEITIRQITIELIGDRIVSSNVRVVVGRKQVRMRFAVRELPLVSKQSTKERIPMLPSQYQFRKHEGKKGT